MTDLVKRLFIGQALRSTQLHEQLLPKRIALPVFASDALSSVAYAPQEILVILSLAGVSFYNFSPWVAAAVVVVMLTVVASYRQNVHAYPSGGGDYEVATVNLGQNAGLTVASALMVDYILTVAVSVANGVDYVGATIPYVAEHKPLVAIAIVVLLTVVNLRGIRESGAAFAIPTYAFMAAVIGLILWGAFRLLVLGQELHAPTAATRSSPSRATSPRSRRPSSSCAPSPPAAPRSPASRRSATVCRPSASPRARTPRPRC
ncbi:APC family permease [Streptosporangium lutulentum]